jgi:hypothetical protein
VAAVDILTVAALAALAEDPMEIPVLLEHQTAAKATNTAELGEIPHLDKADKHRH